MACGNYIQHISPNQPFNVRKLIPTSKSDLTSNLVNTPIPRCKNPSRNGSSNRTEHESRIHSGPVIDIPYSGSGPIPVHHPFITNATSPKYARVNISRKFPCPYKRRFEYTSGNIEGWINPSKVVRDFGFLGISFRIYEIFGIFRYLAVFFGIFEIYSEKA